MKFKVGDKVRVKSKEGVCAGWVLDKCNVGDTGEILEVEPGKNKDDIIGRDYHVSWERISNDGWCKADHIELINNKNTFMDLKEKFTLTFKSEPEKSFRLAGVINGDDLLTEEGQTVFLSWLLKKFGAEFKTEVVDEILKEEDKD